MFNITDSERVELASKIAEEIGLQEVSERLKNISIPVSRLTINDMGNEKQTREDTLKNVGTAFVHQGIIKYTDKHGVTYITKAHKTISKELENAGFIVLDADCLFDQELTQEAITKARNIRKNEELQPYGLSKELLDRIEAKEFSNQNLCKTGWVPFSVSPSQWNLSKTTGKKDVALLASFKLFPVNGTLESITQTDDLNVVESNLLTNAKNIFENMEKYEYNLYSQSQGTELGQE